MLNWNAVSILAAVDARQKQLPGKRGRLLGARDLAHRQHSSECGRAVGAEHIATGVDEGQEDVGAVWRADGRGIVVRAVLPVVPTAGSGDLIATVGR
jgi:hypothetical protein